MIQFEKGNEEERQMVGFKYFSFSILLKSLN